MGNSQFIQSIKDWAAGNRDFASAGKLFEKADEYVLSISKEPYDVSASIVSRTYSKGTKFLFAYGYYTKSAFATECIGNSKRGRLINFKPWYKPGSFYNFEYGFDAGARLIATKQYGTLPDKQSNEYKVLYDTVIEYCGEDEIALSWNLFLNYLELVIVTVSDTTEQITVILECYKFAPPAVTRINIYIHYPLINRFDRYEIRMDNNIYQHTGYPEEVYQNGIYQQHYIYSRDKDE